MRLSAREYYWEGFKVLGRECYRTWRQELFVGVLIAIATYFFTNDKSAWEQLIVVLEATAVVFAVFVLLHLIRTPFILHHGLHTGDLQRTHPVAGVFGIFLLTVFIAVAAYRLIKPRLNPLPNITINPPTVTLETKPEQVPAPKKPQAPTPYPGGAITGAPYPGVLAEMDRLFQIDNNLPKADKDRLSEAFYEFAQSLEHGEDLMQKAVNEYREIDKEGAGIGTDYQIHANKLRDISPLTKQYASDFMQLRTKWDYYREQTQFVFGDNPDNFGPNSLTNAVEGYATYLERWGAIQNKNDQNVLALLGEGKADFNVLIRTFNDWHQGCKYRLEQMKRSIHGLTSAPMPRAVPAIQMFM